jgi:hypothetical protein
MTVLGFMLILFFAAFCAYQGKQPKPNIVPRNLSIPVVTGLIGWPLGGNLLGHFGPDISGIFLMPLIISSMVLVLVASLMYLTFGLRANR